MELGHEEEFEEDEDGEEEEEEEEDGDFINLDEEEEEVIEEEEEVEEDVLELTPIVSAPTITIGDGDLKLEVLDIPEEAPVIDGSE